MKKATRSLFVTFATEQLIKPVTVVISGTDCLYQIKTGIVIDVCIYFKIQPKHASKLFVRFAPILME